MGDETFWVQTVNDTTGVHVQLSTAQLTTSYVTHFYELKFWIFIVFQLHDYRGNLIAFFINIKTTHYKIGDVYGELHFLRTAGMGTVVGWVFTQGTLVLIPNPFRCTHPCKTW